MSTIAITPLTTKLRDTAFDLASEMFTRSSTLHAALRVDLETYRHALRPSFDAMAAQDLSLVAISPEGRLLGCLIATDMYHALSDGPPTGPYPEIAALTHSLTRSYHARHPFGPGEVVLVDMAVTCPEAHGLGLYQAMRAHMELIARAAGFHLIVGELSSQATQHVVLNKMGHRAMVEIRFQAFDWNGTRPFASITSPTSIILAEGTL